jgi:UDP-N-acetylmuramoyl-L-alanyl-D-glutamate--2,6-diaminopimelate ligase
VTLGVLLDAFADRAGVPVPPVGPPASELAVSGIAYDSRQAKAGSVFVALKGLQADGTGFVRDAIARGAIAAVSEVSAPPDVQIVWVEVPDARLALAALAAIFHGDPSDRLLLVGITGTNGKTTVSYLLAAIFEAAGIPCGRIGTVGHRVGRRDLEAARTTPEAPELQALLLDMVAHGCGACVMEVSSHALALKRADYLRFAAGVFTNLTRDHLDSHRNMEEYFAAKRRLFELLPATAVAVVNLDDRRGTELMKTATRHMTYAIDAAADVTPASEIASSFEGLAFAVNTPRGPLHVRSPLVGRANTYNILAAVATAAALDLPISAIERGIASLATVPGRFEVASDRGDDVRVVVDYAHTDDALKNLLETARPLATGHLITVFGCGGDRDPSKRPLMGAVAARLSDLVIVTSDNPRSEDPNQIIEQVMRGIVTPDERSAARGRATGRGARCLAIPDRKAAIDRAVMTAAPGDLVLIAGKGHEKYQVIGDRVLPFDDVDAARAALDRRRSASRTS